jgi:putative SOS response-associated peptidase YedK
MCFFYALSQDAQSLKNRYQLKFDFEFELLPEPAVTSRYYVSGFDFPVMPVIADDHPESLQRFAWGLIPSWVKTPREAEEIRAQTLNARSETVLVKPSFRNAIRKRRCLVPAEGFYEWRLVDGKKYPYYIFMRNQATFSFAGIWEEWTDKTTGEVCKTFSIVTTQANELLAKIHNTKKRMPVILSPEVEREWLRKGLDDEAILSLTRPLAGELLTAHTISKLITSRTGERNVPAVRDYYPYPELVNE